MCRQLSHWFSIKPPSVFFSLRVGLGETFPKGENQFPHLFSAGLRLIIWEGDTKKSQICTKTLWEASKQGIWNHLTGPDLFGTDNGQDDGGQAKFIANNPNIVHSFQNTDQDFTGGETQHLLGDDVGLSLSKEFMDYAGVKPLPGVPFWSILGDPNFLLAYLSQSTKRDLACLRAELTNHSLFCLGSQMTFTFQSPKDLPPGVLDEICKMVDAGGSVDITHVRFNLERAYLVGYAMENGVIIGNSSLKHPRTAFIKRLKTMTGVDFTNFVERGYTSVRPEYRSMGVGAKLLDGLTKRAKDHKIFSIISEENLATQKIAIRNNTKKILTYFSEKLNKEMGVWMPKEMIDNSLDGDKEK
jgi:GNAT superfamily N-acetyltransferase